MYKIQDNKFQLEHGTVSNKLIAIASGKGGVGKSTVTVNLALALSELGHKVGIIDADIYGFSIPRIIGLQEEAQGADNKKINPPETNGIKVMSMGSLVPEDKPVIWRAPLLAGTLKQFMKDVHWGELDYLLFDLPPGTGDMSLNIMQQIPDAVILIVTTPQLTATSVAGRVGKMAEELNTEIAGVVENMSYYQCSDCETKHYIFGQSGGQEMAEGLNTELLAQIPLMPEVREASDQGESILLKDPDSEVSSKFIAIANNIS